MEKQAFETPSNEQTSAGVHAALNCVYLEAKRTLIDGKTSEMVSAANQRWSDSAHHYG